MPAAFNTCNTSLFYENWIMEKTKIDHPDRSFDFITGAYSDAVVAGDFLFVSGTSCG